MASPRHPPPPKIDPRETNRRKNEHRRRGTDPFEGIARLIAAAPELADMAESLASRLEKALIASGTDPEFAAEAVKDARALVARARGRTA